MEKRVHSVILTGPDNLYKSKKALSVGARVVLLSDGSNEKFPHAVKVETLGGLPLGYVQEKPESVWMTIGAKEASPLVGTEKVEAVVKEKIGYVGKSTTFVLEFTENVKVESEKVEIVTGSKVELLLQGSKTKYPSKYKLLEEAKSSIQSGLTVRLIVRMVKDEMVCFRFDEAVGYLTHDEDDVLKPVRENLKEHGELSAKVINVSGRSASCEVLLQSADAPQEKREGLTFLVNKMVTAGIVSNAEMVERIEFMTKAGVTKKQQTAMFQTYKVYAPEIEAKIQKPKRLYQDQSGLVRKSVAYIVQGRNLMFEGERGTGKNVLTETLAWLFKRPLYEFSLNSGQSNESLLGGKTLAENEGPADMTEIKAAVEKWIAAGMSADSVDAFLSKIESMITVNDEGMKMEFEKSSIIEAAEVGGILVLDEFNTSLAHLMSVFNSLLDHRRRIAVPGYKMVEIHPNFMAIATQNKDYIGTFQTNQATTDRFVPVVFPPTKTITAILESEVPNLHPSIYRGCEGVHADMKKAILDGTLSEAAMSIRGFIDACLGADMDLELKDALIDNLSNRCEEEDDRKIIKNIIEDRIA